jgi:hypothetical protein
VFIATPNLKDISESKADMTRSSALTDNDGTLQRRGGSEAAE